MSQYILTARSLVTDSKLVQWTLIVFALFAVGFLFWGIVTPSIILLACLLMGMGFTSRRLLESERRRLVPGMNEACANVAIAAMVVFWLISCGLIVSVVGPMPEMIGGCLLCLAYALWIASLEPLAAILLFPVYATPVLVLTSKESTKQFTDVYQSLPSTAHTVVGVLLAIIGVVIVARYWFVMTSKDSPLIRKSDKVKSHAPAAMLVGAIVVFALGIKLATSTLVEHRSALEWIQSAGQVAGHMLIAYGIGMLLFLFWRMLLWAFFPRRLSLTDVGPMLISQVRHNYVKMLLWSVPVIFVCSFGSTCLFSGWSSDGSINSRIGLMMILTPFITLTILLGGLHKVFERFWVMGVSERRNKTVKVILLLIVAQSLFLNVASLTCIVTIAMSTSLGFVPAFIAAVFCLGLGAVLFWIAARWYPFWLEHVAWTVCLLIGGAGALTHVGASRADATLTWIAEVAGVGPMPCIVAVLFASVLWGLAIWDSSRCLGNADRLLECGNGMSELMFNSQPSG